MWYLAEKAAAEKAAAEQAAAEAAAAAAEVAAAPASAGTERVQIVIPEGVGGGDALRVQAT